MANIEAKIAEDWPDEPLPLRLFQGIARLPAASRSYLTLPMLRRIADDENSSIMHFMSHEVLGRLFQPAPTLKRIYKFAEYLASDRIAILISGFQYIKPDDSVVLLDDSHVGEALATGKFYDPDTGQEIPDWTSRVIVFYKPSPLFAKVVDGR